jgi:ABC-2 type transport system ATP-binding protein
MSVPVLEVIDLHKRYGSLVALDRISFRVEAGEMFGLLGPNGAGKTTLLSIVSSLLAATSGEVRILGQTLTPNDLGIRHKVGIVPQDLAIYGDLTARENLLFFGELYGMGGTDLRDRVKDVLESVGLSDRADSRVSTYSGGMKRRLNLGAALVHRPQLLLLDEPTTGVDPQSRNHIFEEVRRRNAAGLTVVYTSHYMEEVEALCTRIGIIDQGRLAAIDTLPGLLQRIEGSIRFRVRGWTPALGERLGELPGTRLGESNGDGVELSCRDVEGTLLQLLATLKELDVDLTGLTTETPNLERVFLHLTGRTLRD